MKVRENEVIGVEISDDMPRVCEKVSLGLDSGFGSLEGFSGLSSIFNVKECSILFHIKQSMKPNQAKSTNSVKKTDRERLSWIREIESRHKLNSYHTGPLDSRYTDSDGSFCGLKDKGAFNLEHNNTKRIRKRKLKMAYFWQGTYYLYPATFSKVSLKKKKADECAKEDLYEVVRDLSNKKVNAKDTFFTF